MDNIFSAFTFHENLLHLQDSLKKHRQRLLLPAATPPACCQCLVGSRSPGQVADIGCCSLPPHPPCRRVLVGSRLPGRVGDNDCCSSPPCPLPPSCHPARRRGLVGSRPPNSVIDDGCCFLPPGRPTDTDCAWPSLRCRRCCR